MSCSMAKKKPWSIITTRGSSHCWFPLSFPLENGSIFLFLHMFTNVRLYPLHFECYILETEFYFSEECWSEPKSKLCLLGSSSNPTCLLVSLIHEWFRVSPQIQEVYIQNLGLPHIGPLQDFPLTFQQLQLPPNSFLWFFRPERLQVFCQFQLPVQHQLWPAFRLRATEPENSVHAIPSFQVLILFQKPPAFSCSPLPTGSWFLYLFKVYNFSLSLSHRLGAIVYPAFQN